MKYELLKRTAIALFVGGIVSTYAMAEDEDKAVDDALAALGKAINANATKQTEATEAVKSELTKKIEEQDKKINDNTTAIFGDDDDPENPGLLNTVDKHTDAIYGTKEDPDSGLINVVNKHSDAIAGVTVNSYNNTLTLSGFKDGDDLYDIDPETGKVTKKTATAKDVEADPLKGKGVINSINDITSDVDDLEKEVIKTVGTVNDHTKVLDGDGTDANPGLVSKVNNLEDDVYGDGTDANPGLVGVVDNHAEAIYGDGTDANPGLMKVVSKQTEAINELKAYNHLDDVKALVENKADKTDVYTKTESDSKLNAKADKQALEDLKEEVKDNEEGIGALSGVVNELGKDVGNLTEEHRDLEGKHNKLAEGVKEFTETYNKFADNTNAELDKKADADDVEDALSRKANVSDVYTKAESNSKLDAKANVADVYSKTETDNKFALKANSSVVSAHAVDINKLRTDVNTHTKRLDHLDNRVNKLDKDLKRGLAAQAALTGLFQPYTVGKANFTAAVGGYKSQTAVAIGTGYRYNQNIATKAGVAFTQGGGVTYNAGVNFEW
ncbi:YadA C-terminal domain-containing protein [uncultured Haemophilus sp.]|uniref:YadA C-terminal domain-containing protein n=1 Tax=uncultured Haemophilus sp. TaxID=237779 RepID=UPI00280528BD|nr:YadA C-terminal domain-containing protein [uncultured Haemophilus sp.]